MKSNRHNRNLENTILIIFYYKFITHLYYIYMYIDIFFYKISLGRGNRFCITASYLFNGDNNNTHESSNQNKTNFLLQCGPNHVFLFQSIVGPDKQLGTIIERCPLIYRSMARSGTAVKFFFFLRSQRVFNFF